MRTRLLRLLAGAGAVLAASGGAMLVRPDAAYAVAGWTVAALLLAAVGFEMRDARRGLAAAEAARREAEQALGHSESLRRAMSEGSTLCMGVVELLDDGDVRHLHDNANTCRVFGVPPGGTEGRRASELGAAAPFIRTWLGHYRESARRGAAVSFEYTLQGPQGLGRHRATVAPLPAAPGEPPRFTYVSEDITARHAAALLVQQSEAHARLALDVAEIGTWSWHVDDDVFEADERCREIAGLPARAALTLEQAMLRLHPDDRGLAEATLSAVLAPGSGGAGGAEVRVRHGDGSLRWVVVRCQLQAVAAGAGLPSRLLMGTVVDVTERKASEQALAQSDRRKNEFLATLAHELRNPLAPLRNGLAVLRLAGDDATTRERTLQTLERQVGLMVRLIDDLLDLGRISRDQLELRRRPINLAQVVEGGVETGRPLVDAQCHVLSVVLPPRPVVVDGDAARLVQVVANLLNNAAKYTPAGGSLELRVETQGRDAVLTVQDDGIGIPPAMLERVFEMFAQVDRSQPLAQGGLGIGLAISRRLVQLHGGSLVAQSDGEGRGSRFVMRLPLAVEPPAAPAAERPRSAPAGARRVLVVDDNVDAAASLQELLGLAGHQVHVAHHGRVALDVAEACRPDIALLDLGLPGLDGCELARRLRQRPWAAQLVLVALTGWGQDQDRARTHAAGFHHHLVKPVDLAALERLVGSAVAA